MASSKHSISAPAASRRGLLAGVPAAILAIGATSTSAAPMDGDPLMILGHRFEQAWRDQVHTFNSLVEDLSDEAGDACDAAFQKTKDIVSQIQAARATSLAGLIVKARACSWCHQGDPYDANTFGASATTDRKLAATMIRDLIALSGEPLPEIPAGL